MRYLFAASLLSAAANADELAQLVEEGRWRKARVIVEQQESARQTDARFLAEAAKVRLAYDELDKAVELGEKAAALDPKCAECQFVLYEAYGSQAQRASVLRQPGLARKCKKAVDQALAIDPKHVDALLGSMMYLSMAPGFFGGDKTRAKAIPDEIAKFNPGRGHLAKAELALITDRNAPVRDHYRAAVAADPNLAEARLRLAFHFARQNPTDFAESAAQAREAVRIAPRRVAGWEALAFALGRLGQTPDLDKALADMGKQLPDEFGAHYRGAEGLIAGDKDLARAEELLKTFLAQPGQGPQRPGRGAAQMRLAQIYEKGGRKPEAIEMYETALRTNPKNAEIQQALKRLRG